jgi:ABC-type uncharacterized transport system permease subunit
VQISLILALVAFVAYAAATKLQWQQLRQSKRRYTPIILCLSAIAIILHGYVLHLWIDLPGIGQNLSYLNLLSMVFWLVALLTLLTLIRLPVLNLILFIFPFAALSLIADALFYRVYLVDTAGHPEKIAHILLSIIAFSFFCIAAIQALFLTIQERSLRSKNVGVFSLLPPLETMERFFFQTLWIGFILLTAVFVTALIFFQPVFTPGLLAKTLFTLMAWLLYAIILLGRYLAGWRGKAVIRASLLGMVLLVLAYVFTRV